MRSEKFFRKLTSQIPRKVLVFKTILFCRTFAQVCVLGVFKNFFGNFHNSKCLRKIEKKII